jgi:integrase
MKSRHLKLIKRSDLRPVAPNRRKPNTAYRVREHLTEAEIAKLLTALKANRYGHRDWPIGLLIYRHGLRVSEACDLRWDDLDSPKRTIAIRRLKGSTDSVHYLERDELAGRDCCGRKRREAVMCSRTSEASRSGAWALLA